MRIMLQHSNSEPLCSAMTEFKAFIWLQYACGLYEKNTVHSHWSKAVGAQLTEDVVFQLMNGLFNKGDNVTTDNYFAREMCDQPSSNRPTNCEVSARMCWSRMWLTRIADVYEACSWMHEDCRSNLYVAFSKNGTAVDFPMMPPYEIINQRKLMIGVPKNWGNFRIAEVTVSSDQITKYHKGNTDFLGSPIFLSTLHYI